MNTKNSDSKILLLRAIIFLKKKRETKKRDYKLTLIIKYQAKFIVMVQGITNIVRLFTK